MFEAPQDIPEPELVRGARRLNKGNRISCLIENLGTERQGEDEDGRREDDTDREIEELKLGKDRISHLQNMFSGSPAGADSSPRLRNSESETPVTEILELKDEGLVSANLQRFSSGNILGSSSQVFRKTSLETNYIDKKHIEAVTAKE